MPATNDHWLHDLRTQFGVVSVQDMEMDPDHLRVLFSQTERGLGTFPEVVKIESDGSVSHPSPPGPGGTNVDVQIVDARGVMVPVGLNASVPEFPNGAEWARATGQAVLYFSALTGPPGPLGRWPNIDIQRASFSASTGTWTSRGAMPFSTPNTDRYLFAASYSRAGVPQEELDDRIVVYVSTPHGFEWNGPIGSDVCWAWDRNGATAAQPINDQVIGNVPIQSIDNPLASPVRPIPSTYSAFVAEHVPNSTGGTDLNLLWVDFRDPTRFGGVESRQTIQRYRNVNGPGIAGADSITLMGLGARRWPLRDSFGPAGDGYAFLLYAYFCGPGVCCPPCRSRHPAVR